MRRARGSEVEQSIAKSGDPAQRSSLKNRDLVRHCDTPFK